jgi:GNAT superfamily N-acetyltransferase
MLHNSIFGGRNRSMPQARISKTSKFNVRFAQETDVPDILAMIRELAEYEKLLDKVEVTEQTLRDSLRRRVVEALIAEQENRPVGYALFFHNFSSFVGREGIFVEDIYVKPELRRSGLGRRFFAFIAAVAAERGCTRIDWTCLNWNAPSIEFYKGLGAEPLEEWITFRLRGEDIKKLAAQA